jgi:hypothetical protein
VIDGASQVVGFTRNFHEYLVHMPAPLRDLTHPLRTSFAYHSCREVTESIDPKPDALVANIIAALMEQTLMLRSKSANRMCIITAIWIISS